MKRAPELRDLSEDHHTGLVLARRCKQVSREDSRLSLESVWAHVQAAFSNHLEPHFQIEEQHLVPALEAIGEAALAGRIREDHRALRALLGVEPVTRDLAERFGALLYTHIRFEEREVFSATQSRLAPTALEAIAAACLAVSRTCPNFLEP
jgi:hemerythrin-like domain-containing protein